eukprot:4908290-Pyramimonas_sp.AAC.1
MAGGLVTQSDLYNERVELSPLCQWCEEAIGMAHHRLFACPAIACWARDLGFQEVADAGRRAPQDDLGLVRGLLNPGLDQAPPPGTGELCRRAAGLPRRRRDPVPDARGLGGSGGWRCWERSGRPLRAHARL